MKMKIKDVNTLTKTEPDSVNKLVKYYFFEILGWKNVVLTLGVYLAYILYNIITNNWLSKWSKNSLGFENQIWYPVIYMLLTLVSFTLFMCRINCFSSTLVNGAQLIFKKLMSRLLSRPIGFFESTPSGEII